MKKSPLLIALTVFLLGIALLMVPTVGANSPLTQAESYSETLGIVPGNPAGAPERVNLSLALQSMDVVSPAYGTELQNNFLAQLDLTDPATLTNLADSPAIYAADLAVDNSLVYAIVSNIDPEADEFITFDLSEPNTPTVIGPISAVADEEWGGMAVTPDNTLYASSGECGTRSTLYTINPATGVATEVGEITDSPCIAAIAADASGMLWGVDIVSDTLVTIDKTTGASSLAGSLGFNASGNQGLEYNENNNALYLAAFNRSPRQAELRKLNLDGSTAMSDTIGDSVTGTVQMGWLAIQRPVTATIPAVPAITLDKTVGTDAASCATEDNAFVDAGDMVYYCYTVTNVGDITLTNHSLVDSELGALLTDTVVSLAPAASYMVTQSASIMETTVNTATWTATNGISETNAIDTAMVTIIPENGSAPDADIPDDNATGVTDTISISESGTLTDLNVYLDVHHPWVGDLIVTLEHQESGMSVELVNRPEAMTTTRALAAPGDCDGNDIHNTLDDDATPSIQTDCQGGDGQAYMMGTSYQPAGSLDDFAAAGVPWAGTWELNVRDDSPTQDGTFVIWALEAALGEAEIDVEPTSISDTLGLNDISTHPLTISNSGDAVLSWEISSDVTWASVDTMSGTTAISDSSPLVVSFDSTGLAADTYTGTLTIANNDADEDPVEVEVMLIVEELPADIDVDPTALTSTQLTSEVTTQTLTISNTGDVTLTWSIVISDAIWASVDMISGTTVADGSSDVIVSFDSADLEPGTYDGILSIASNDPDEPTVNVSLTLIVDPGPQPDIAVDPTSLASTLEVGDNEEQTLTISNNGDADLIWTIEEEAVGLVQPYRSMNTSKLAANTEVGTPTGNNSFAASGATNVESFGQQPLNRDGDIMITHSASQDVVEGSIACQDNATGFHTENSYIRVFNMADFGLGDFNITNVEFGVESATGGTGSQPVEVNLYTLDGALSFANMTLIGRSVVDIEDQALTIASVDVTGFVPDGSILVVEVFTPNGVSDGNSFFIGSNPDGQTALTYLAAAGCGITEPTDVADIGDGFPEMQIVMNVTGVVDGEGPFCTPTDLGWVSLDSMGATTPAGESNDVTVTFDATGLAADNYDGNLCVGSNDPAKPIVIVPLQLTVEGEPEPDPLMCNGSMIEFENGIPADWVTANSGNVYWSTTDDAAACGTVGNQTNGSGQAACANSDATNGAGEPYDAELWTNAFDIDAPFNYAILNFEAAYRDVATADMFDVDISNDGGTTWTTLLSWDEDHRDPGEAVSLDLSAYAGQSGLIVRYRYHGEGWDWWAQVDEVSLSCAEIEPEAEVEIEIPDIEIDAGEDLSQTLTISNTGSVAFNWVAFTEDTTGARAAGACSGDLDAFPGTTLDPTSGTTAAGNASDVTMNTDASSLPAGDYTGNACIRNSDTGDVTAIPLTMTVIPTTAVEMAELATSSSRNMPLALAVAGMMLVLAGGFVVRRRRTQ